MTSNFSTQQPPPLPSRPQDNGTAARPPMPWDDVSHPSPAPSGAMPMRLRKNAPAESPRPSAPQKEAPPASARLSKLPPPQHNASSSHRSSSSDTSSRASGPIPHPYTAPPSNGPIADPRSRQVSAPGATLSAPGGGSRPQSREGRRSPSQDGERRGRLVRSLLPGSRSRSRSKDAKKSTNNAWILDQNTDYNTSLLTDCEKVPELWNEIGNVYVHLQPKGARAGPSFKVPWFAISSSRQLTELIDGEMASAYGQTGHQSYNEYRLYFPTDVTTPTGKMSPEDHAKLISIRNMFAFLTGQPLVATPARPTLFKILMGISELLSRFDFTSPDGESFGEAVNMSFSFLMEQKALADVRHSREKTIEALVLGERMKSIELYNEAFAHAVGKWAALKDLNSPLLGYVSETTRTRVERSSFELANRQSNVNNRLEAFEFPALFSGVANSTALTEYRDVKFQVWKKSFGRLRQLLLGHYKAQFGSWPPKARSKKNTFSESGLNRRVLKILYKDLASLYDLLVDRESLTTRREMDQADEESGDDIKNPHTSAMRKVLAEFDNSSPPVLPAIPFDLPKLPSMTAIKENYHELSAKEQMKLDKSLQDYQMLLILNKSYNFDALKQKSAFLQEFTEFEKREAKGKTAVEMADQRLGYWLFLYVVIQSLPLLVVDAPGLKYEEGVEYFLCQPPKGLPPWMGTAPARKRWFNVDGRLVELLEDTIETSVDGIFQRSHCWEAGSRWEAEGIHASPPPVSDSLPPLEAPQGVFADMDPATPGRSESPPSGPPGAALRPGSGSPGMKPYRSSVGMGLEPVSLPPGNHSLPGSRAPSMRGDSPVYATQAGGYDHNRSVSNLAMPPPAQSRGHSRNSSRQEPTGGSTFDDILKGIEEKPKKKKGFF